ncbi:MAG: DUF1667 domain-containing protein [Treponemataceae bacterium]|nr:DUF1667 domain-containing protein [Treponemataceae bacterium]
MKKYLTCIICPMGCSLEIDVNENEENIEIKSVSGNNCRRGEQYAKKELTEPTRTLTTTMAVSGSTLKLVPVKTDGEIPKDMLLKAMEVIRRAKCTAPVKCGDILLLDLLGTGVSVVACADVL